MAISRSIVIAMNAYRRHLRGADPKLLKTEHLTESSKKEH